MNVLLSPNALHDFQQLDRNIAGRVVQQIGRLARNYEQIPKIALQGNLNYLYKYRVGDYRVLFEEKRNEDMLVIHRIKHRREVYN